MKIVVRVQPEVLAGTWCYVVSSCDDDMRHHVEWRRVHGFASRQAAIEAARREVEALDATGAAFSAQDLVRGEVLGG